METRHFRRAFCATLVVLWIAMVYCAAQAQTPSITQSVNAPVALALTLPLRNQNELSSLLDQLYNPKSPQYRQFLTPEQFTQKFGPTQQDYDQVRAFAEQQGLTVTSTHTNRAVLDVEGTPAQVERAFQVQLTQSVTAEGHLLRRANATPRVPSALAGKLSGVIGLEETARWQPSAQLLDAKTTQALKPYQVGSGPYGGLTPNDIKTAYNLTGVSLTGADQTLALFELDGYKASDINAYTTAFGLRSVPLQNVLVRGFNGQAGTNSGEVTLDIQLQIALAPGISRILVYEAPNSNAGVIDAYNRIAADNLAKQVSSSWGLPEKQASPAVRSAENAAFQQMAAQGQTIFAASGDHGAYDDGTHLGVDDPASQPYMTSVGGTQLFMNNDRTYKNETSWNHNSPASGAGGGGPSTIWSKPSYQSGLGASATMRDVPDVSLNADPYTGYAIYLNGNWVLFGGTSCAAPLWSAFTALVNQQRARSQLRPLGFANPVLYQIGRGARYATLFHDIRDGSTNLYYACRTGYDDATGWGSFNGAALLNELAPAPPPVKIVGAVTVIPERGAVVVQWTTNIPASSTAALGISSATLSRQNADVAAVTSHSVRLTGLSSRHMYYVSATSTASGQTVTSSVMRFSTL